MKSILGQEQRSGRPKVPQEDDQKKVFALGRDRFYTIDSKALPPSVTEAQGDDYRKLLKADPTNPSCMDMDVIHNVTRPLDKSRASTYVEKIDRNEDLFTFALVLLSLHRSKEEIAELDTRARNSTSPSSELEEHFLEAWSEICDQLHGAPDNESKRDIHGKHFHRLILSLLTVELAKEPIGKTNFKFEDYSKRKDMALKRNIYAKHLLNSKSLDKKGFDRETFVKLQDLEFRYSVLRMGEEMEAEIEKCTEGKLSETYISRVLENIGKLSGDTTFVQVQLALLGIEDTSECPEQSLRAAYERYRDALVSVERFEDLRNDEHKFRLVRKAVWFGRYLLLAIETKDKRKCRNGLFSRGAWSGSPDAVDEAFKHLLRFDVVPGNAVDRVYEVVKKIEGKSKQKKAQQSVGGGDTRVERNPKPGKARRK